MQSDRCRVGIIDSGVNPGAVEVAGGVAITAQGASTVYLDFLGHGTAVAATIREKAPDAILYAVKIFDQALVTDIDRLIRAIDWCIDERVDVINLSLGTPNDAHEKVLRTAVGRAGDAGIVIVAPGDGTLPGRLPGVFSVAADRDCPHDRYWPSLAPATTQFRASGYALDSTLYGSSFAVANFTGFVVRARQSMPEAAVDDIAQRLAALYPL